MLELRQFNLQLAFARPGALGEDVEDERRAVNDFALEDFFEVAALRGRKVVVENHRVHVVAPAEVREFLGLALADERGGRQRLHFLDSGVNDLAAGGLGQFAQFGERIAKGSAVMVLAFNADEEDPFRPRVSVFNERFQLFANYCDPENE